jgi:phosphodiester glycosidase
VLRKAVLLAALAVCVLPPAASTAATSEEIMPGIRYIREKRTVGGAPVLFHVVYGPKPGGLYGLRPVLSNERVSGTETLTSMQRRLLRRNNLVGVNGDLFNWTTGHPSGIFVAGGVVASRPLPGRSSLGIGLDGLLRFARIRYAGTFQFDGHGVRVLREFNRPTTSSRGFTLFTSAWGSHTPHRSYTSEAILSSVTRAFPNVDRRASVVKVVRGSGHAIPPGGAILQARREARTILSAQALPGGGMTFRIGLTSWWEGVKTAIGGGPVLVRAGVPVYRANEWFSTYQLSPRHPRTAVGQLADGRIVLLAVDGRVSGSRGLTNNQLANQMVHYGAVEAMAFDAGGSTEMAFNGRVLNNPSDGQERPLADSLQLTYIGAYARKPRRPTFSPNGDGYADTQRLFAKFVRRSTVNIRLLNPNGTVRWEYNAVRSPGTLRKDLATRSLMEGTWRWIISGVDRHGRVSRMERRFRVNKTLGFLMLSKRLMRVRRGVGGHLRIGFRLAHTAGVKVFISKPSGRVVRTLISQTGVGPGGYAVIWNGRNRDGYVVRSGTFVATVRATNSLGRVEVAKRFLVRRVS